MTELFNKVSNYLTTNTGNSIMAKDDTVVMTFGEYRCSDSEDNCSDSHNMLYTDELYGAVKCAIDDASCLLDGENDKRLLNLWGTGSNKLTIRAITFKNGHASKGGGIWIWGTNTKVDLELCVFTNCYAYNGDYGGGAIYVDNKAGIIVYIKGTSFSENIAFNGADIYKSGGLMGVAIINVLASCPTPYTDNSPTKGK